MPEHEPTDYVVPVVSEQVQADAVPVETGRVRVVKRVESHEEVVEQEVKRGQVEVTRVAKNEPVSGPMQPRREGNTLIVPVVSEIVKIEKQWVLTEEIHLTQTEETRTVNEQINVSREVAEVQRLDPDGKVISDIAATPKKTGRVLSRDPQNHEPERKVLTSTLGSMVKKS